MANIYKRTLRGGPGKVGDEKERPAGYESKHRNQGDDSIEGAEVGCPVHANEMGAAEY